MSKKSTATKTTATTKSAATKSSRKSSATRTKLPVETSEAVESTMSPVEIAEVAPAQPVTVTAAVIDAPADVTPPAQPEEPAIIEAMAPPSRTLSREEFEAMVRREAYMRAQQRGFRNGSPLEDWVAAEIDVRARLTAEGASLPTA